MRKLAVWMLCLVLMVVGCGSAFALEQGEWEDAESFMVANLDVTAEEWVESEENQGLALACMVIEIITVYGDEPFSTFFMSGEITSYMGWADLEEGQTLVGVFDCKDTQEMWVCLITLGSGEMSVMFDTGVDGEDMMQSLVEDGFLEGGYYICEQDMLLASMQAISDALSDEE